MFNTNEKIICPICKKDLPKDSEFCQYCGHKIPIVNEMPPVDDEIVPNNEGKNRATEDFEAEIPVNYTMDAKCHYETDDDFGLTPDKPIYTMGIDEQEKYLKSLRTINGEPIKWNRRGSMSVDGINGMVDVYDTYLLSGKEYKTIYMNMYGTYRSALSPKGFTLLTLKNKHNKSHTSKNVKVIVPIVILSVVIIIVSAIAVLLGIKLSKGTQEQSNKGNQETSIDENTPKDRDYLYNWLLENGELASGGTSVVYKEVYSNNRVYSLYYNTSSANRIFASYTSKNSEGYIIIVTVELFTSGDEETNAEIVVINSDDKRRGLKYYHNPQQFTVNTPISIVSAFGDHFPDKEASGKYDDPLESFNAWKKPMEEVEDVGKKSIHSGICSIIDWLNDSICTKAKMDLSDFGYELYR